MSYSSLIIILGSLSIMSIGVYIFGLLLYCLRPDFAIIIKNKSAMEQAAPIEIKRKRKFSAIGQDSGVGFSEVIPTDESEKAIREISAIINDIQKMGDLGVQKWVK